MRSYAYYVERDGHDEWCHAQIKSNIERDMNPLASTWIAAGQKSTCIGQGEKLKICENPSEVYLDHILARGNPEKKIRLQESGLHSSEIQKSFKREHEHEHGRHGKHEKHDVEATLNPDECAELQSCMHQMLSLHHVLSRERVFQALKDKERKERMTLDTGDSPVSKLHTMARAYEDATSSGDADLRAKIDLQLHGWLMAACGENIKHFHLQWDGVERYVKVLDMAQADNMLRKVVLDVILSKDAAHARGQVSDSAVQREHIQNAADDAKVPWNERQYEKIMKEYCVLQKKGGKWWMKSGNEVS